MKNSTSPGMDFTELLQEFFIVSKHLSLYSEENAIIKDTTNRLMRKLEGHLRAGNTIHVGVAKYNFIVHGNPLDPKNRLFSKSSYRMFQHGISSFSITPELTVPELYSFLRLLQNKPADTWDQGGICKCLEQLKVTGIQVTEMSKSDFSLLETSEFSPELNHIQSSKEFWGRFARTLFYTLSGENPTDFNPDNASPSELAEKINKLLAQDKWGSHAKQDSIIQGLSRSILATQGNKVSMEIYLKLADFVNHLSDDFRENIIGGICNLQILKENAENFFNGFSDDALLNAFKQVTQQESKVSPVIMSLITKLAGEKKLVSDQEIALLHDKQAERLEKAKELLRSDEFDKYVPQQYQKTLRQILSTQQLPKSINNHLQKMKKQLESVQLEEQIAKLSLHLLNSDPDPAYLPALQKQVIESMRFYLEMADYQALLNLYRSCFEGKSSDEITDFVALIPETFYQQILTDASRLGKEFHSLISEVIILVDTGFIVPLFENITTEKDRASRFLFLNCLKQIGQHTDVSKTAVSYLNDERWYVIRNMLLLLGQLGSKDDLPQIKKFLKHSHPRVRMEALKTCLLLKDNQSLAQLYRGLFAKDRQEVLHTISISGFIDVPEVSKRLVAMLENEQVFNFDFDIQKALVSSLAKRQNKQALAIFSKKLNSSRIFHHRARHKLKLEIIAALQYYPADLVIPLLKQQADKGAGTVALQAKQIINKFLEEKK